MAFSFLLTSGGKSQEDIDDQRDLCGQKIINKAYIILELTAKSVVNCKEVLLQLYKASVNHTCNFVYILNPLT